MTYVSKKEKVFDLPDQDDSSSVSLVKPDTKLKRFPSVSDRRAWTSEECQRYQHLYGLVNGSESNLSKSSSFKYIPFDVLLAILMAEKDAYIQELLDRQEDNRLSTGGKLYKADGFEDSDDDREALIRKDAEVVALKNKIAGLESELEDYRDTLTKAMHKLENMDAIISENNLLREKIKYSEETIRCLEQRKVELEKELECYRNTYSNPDDSSPRRKHAETRQRWDGGDSDKVVRLSSERDILIQQVEELQKELERAKTNAAEVEVLRKISETTSSSLEEVSKENECYKKKLESMKFLEKHIEELKKQAHTLTDKYKKESQRANDQLKQINVSTKELQMLREERDKLQARVGELMTYESQYMSLKAKLHQVELIIDENEILNKKLIQLDRLELENEQLKIRIDQLKSAEVQAVDDKEKIAQLQCAVADQEEEMKKLLKHIEKLSEGYTDRNEIHRLRNEIEEKNGKLKKYEKQLNDIPVLESEIDELKNKLQKCIDDFKADKDLLRRLQEELEVCRKRCQELEKMAPLCRSDPISNTKEGNDEDSVAASQELRESKVESVEKGENTIETPRQMTETQTDKVKQEDKATLIVDHALTKLQEVEEQNEILKGEVTKLTSKLSQINLDELIAQTNELKNLLSAKDRKILDLTLEVNGITEELKNYERVKRNLEQEVGLLKRKTDFLQKELSLKGKDVEEMRKFLEVEKKGREFAINMVQTLEDKLEAEKVKRQVGEAILKLQKEEANIAKQEIYLYLAKEVSNLNDIIKMSRILNRELQTENNILREMKEYLERIEIRGLKDLISRLRAEVRVLKSLSKPELEGECLALQQQVKKLLNETDGLIDEISGLKLSLEVEKSAKDRLENEVINLQAELSACVTAGNAVLGREMSAKETIISSLREELAYVKNDLENSMNELQALREKNGELVENVVSLEFEQKELKNQINILETREESLNKVIREFEEREREHLEKSRNAEEVRAALRNIKEELCLSKDSADVMRERIRDLEEIMKEKEEILKSKEENLRAKEESLKMKEEELQLARLASSDAKNELNKLKSEIGVLRLRLEEKGPADDAENQDLLNYEKDLEEKYALEEALRSIENELDELKVKLEECKKMEQEMSNLKNKRDSLLEKMSGFENEVESLKKKLCDFESVKSELDKLKAEKNVVGGDLEISKLYEEVLELKAQIVNLKAENESLKEELSKTEGLLEVCRNLQKTIPENQMPLTTEFYTPPALLSPHSSERHDSCEMISMESHKKEIEELKTLYEQQMKELKESNAEKLKKLKEHYEKEANCRTKSYYETINAVKSSYENDIKKLVEKHKVSIMRLQGLHEDEVQELNTTYETQMEAMQTQNENLINDLRTESAEKYKQLREQHNRDIRELARKYEDLLREKEAFYLAEKSNVETGLTETTNDLKEIHKQAMDNLTQFYQNSIVELEEKHNQELKKCKKNNLKRIELMKNKYEALLVEERKKYEEQLEELLLQLKEGQQGDNLRNEENHCEKKKPLALSDPCLDFSEVLQKILNEGLECLTLDELILVHSKTCFMPQSLAEDGAGGGEFTSRFGGRCKHRELMVAEKEELLKRIFTLEHEIVIKQLETHEAIVNMEAAEICRIQELKNALCTAQQKNAELKRLLSNQSKHEMDLKIDRYMSDRQASFHESNVVEKVKELEKEKAEKKRLEEELQKEKAKVRSLMATMETEKERHQSQRKKDAEYVESIRQRLEEALNHEQMMETQLDYEVKLRAKLEAELQSLQKSLSLLPDLSSPPLQIETKYDFNVGNNEEGDFRSLVETTVPDPVESFSGIEKDGRVVLDAKAEGAVKNFKNQDQSEVTKEAKHSRSKSRHRSKLKAINN